MWLSRVISLCYVGLSYDRGGRMGDENVLILDGPPPESKWLCFLADK